MIKPIAKSRPTRVLLCVAWILLFIMALAFDVPMAKWVAEHHPVNKSSALVMVIKAPGIYYTTLGIALLLFLAHPLKAQAAVLPLIAGAIGGIAYLLIKWFVGRHRPVLLITRFDFHPFVGGFRGLFHERGLSFPSGHTCLAFATAMSLTILIPRWKILWFVIAVAVAGERVLENAHYLSDVVAGIGVGTLSALLAQSNLDRYWPNEKPAGPN